MSSPKLHEADTTALIRPGIDHFSPVTAEMHYYRNLDTIIDEVHGLFDGWEKQLQTYTTFSIETLHLAKLAVHEWLANLLQHADFQNRLPEIGVCLSPSDDKLWCVIEDNSEGFNLEGYLKDHPKITLVLPDRGMGLLMLRSCTEELRYEKLQSGKQHLEFYVPSNQDPHLEIPFS